MAIALPVMMARPRPRFRGRAGAGGDAGAVGGADLGRLARRCLWRPASGGGAVPSSLELRLLQRLPVLPRPPGWPSLLRLALLLPGSSPLGPAERGSAEGQLAWRLAWPGLGGDVRLPLGLLRHLARPGCGDGRRWLGGSLLWPGGQQSGRQFRPCCVCGRLGSRCPRGALAGAGVLAARRGGAAPAWACALSSAARMRCRSDSDSAGRVNGPVPGPRFVPGTRRGRGEPPLSSATPTPLAACTTARSFQDRGAQNGLPINTNRSTNDQ